MPLGGESIVNLIDYRSIGADGLKPYTTVLEYCLRFLNIVYGS
jgi:hypothetical protein